MNNEVGENGIDAERNWGGRALEGPLIRIEVFRHDEKDKAEDDWKAPLTGLGRERAVEAGKKRLPKLNQGYVVCSPRERAAHAALLQFFGPQFHELDLAKQDLQMGMGKVKEHLKERHGVEMEEKFGMDERLDFNYEHPEFSRKFYDEYGKEAGENKTLDWQREASDKEILELAKKTNSNDELAGKLERVKGFSRLAGDLAEVLLEYAGKIEQWVELYSENSDSFDNDEMQFFLGTHSQNTEAFLLRAMELIEGEKYARDFVDNLPSRKSFVGYSEGFTFWVYWNGGERRMILSFREMMWEISEDVLIEMIRERDQFNWQVKKNLAED